jgi:hypothetical protein
VIEAIDRLRRGESLESIQAAQPRRASPEEAAQRVAALRERIAQNQAAAEQAKPKVNAQAELKRRQDVQEALEAKRKHEESQRQLAAQLAAKEKREEQEARERVRAKIAQQRGAAQKSAAPPPQEAPKPRTGQTGAGALRFNVPGVTPSPILSFPAETTMAAVDREFRQKYPQFSASKLQYSIALPLTIITAGDMGKTLADLGLGGRATVNVTAGA